MNSLTKKGKLDNLETESRFEKYNLKENPFPATPFVNQGDSDKRYNGEIYEETIRSKELDLIEKNFLKIPQNNSNHIRIGYILDNSYVGRGNGKSTFALNLLKKINKNFCLDISEGANKCFGLYIVPEPSGRTRTFSNLLDLIIEAIIQSNVLNYSLAAIRLEAILELKLKNMDESELTDEETLIKVLNTLVWYNENGIKLKDIHEYYSKKIEFNMLSSDNPLRKNRTSYDGTNLSIVTSNSLYLYYKSFKKDSEKINFIFNDLVNIFLMAGFNGSYIIIDDFERIPDFQSDRQKRDFAIELRTSFFDGSFQNAKIGFYNLILMLHAGVPRLIQKAWGDSGMDQRSPISSVTHSTSHIISFDKLNDNYVTLLIKKYLSEYRINPEDSISPFTSDALKKMGEYCEYNAAKILTLANNLIEHSLSGDIKEIDKELVEKMLQITPIETEGKTSIIEEKSEDLLSKAAKNG
ncbi:MAG: hypothetical protein LBO74_12185 [Candidatus Symbiothrix sp.]|jgi:hypothetical protein|nr:hypothetical protein [Candidatus Symbiothrix sp.]